MFVVEMKSCKLEMKGKQADFEGNGRNQPHVYNNAAPWVAPANEKPGWGKRNWGSIEWVYEHPVFGLQRYKLTLTYFMNRGVNYTVSVLNQPKEDRVHSTVSSGVKRGKNGGWIAAEPKYKREAGWAAIENVAPLPDGMGNTLVIASPRELEVYLGGFWGLEAAQAALADLNKQFNELLVKAA